jgi:hypothetical protein
VTSSEPHYWTLGLRSYSDGYPALAGVRNLANVSLWGARSGLKMAWWSPNDAVELWSFQAEI